MIVLCAKMRSALRMHRSALERMRNTYDSIFLNSFERYDGSLLTLIKLGDNCY